MKPKSILVKSNVKDESLIEKRRQQILQASIRLFREKGFHPTTTREIAAAAGFSIGTLYEYVRTKEDVLFLICDSIFHKVMDVFEHFPKQGATIDRLKGAIGDYFILVDSMLDEFTIMYQETKSLQNEAMQYVLNKEIEMVGVFEKMLESCIDVGELKLPRNQVYLAANQILVLGQSWAFRKWALHQQYSIDEYTKLQIELFMNGIQRDSLTVL